MTNPFDIEYWRSFYARHLGTFFLIQAVGFVLIGLVIAGLFWRPNATPTNPQADAVVTPVAASDTTWTCAMHPQIRQPKPGKCPICGMDLIPVTKTPGGMRTLAISPEAQALMSIETAPVERKYVMHEIPMVGRVDYDETKLGYITAWVPGRLDRLFVDYTGVEVKKGDHLVSIYSEQLYTTQEELIQALKNRSDRTPTTTKLIQPIDLVDSAREKLRLLGLTEEQIAEIEKLDKPSDHVTIYAPQGGIVIEKLKQQGERVQLGERIYTIADLSQVWVHLDVYESDLPWIRYGQDVTITTEAYPGEEFHGRIAFIQPVLNDKTRTVKVRVNVPNDAGKLKPEMFVRSIVRPRVAAGGKIMDPNLAGKWISPMHPEIVKDEPGKCDICGMPLVRAESLGYVTPSTDADAPPLVVPYSAALLTGTRAIVYVQLPNMPSAVEPAMLTLAAAIQEGDTNNIRDAFNAYGSVLDLPNDQPGTAYARQLWHAYADRLARHALDGQRVTSVKAAEQVLGLIETVMSEAREQFAPADHPTFEGREIVLGPRAGDYYLVRNGLAEGELVVTQGNFKIDAEIQIQAKPSMMTPAGGGGHEHGGHGAVAAKGDGHAGQKMMLPADFNHQMLSLEAAYQQVTQAIQEQEVDAAAVAFAQFGQALDGVDGTSLTGQPRMLWKEFAMLLGNDVVEGRDAWQPAEADRVFFLLKGHMRRVREQFGMMPAAEMEIEHIAVAPEFQAELVRVWEQYLSMGQALAADNFTEARQSLTQFAAAVAAVNGESLNGRAQEVWSSERANLVKLVDELKQAKEMQALRAEFSPLSQEIGVLAKTFGFGASSSVYQLHCPMAFENQGAVWYQNNDQTRNPYFGSTMLKCADRVERLEHDDPGTPDTHQSHEAHEH